MFVSFAGIDSSELLFEAAKNRTGFQIFLGSPYLPVPVKNPFVANPDLFPAVFEFTRRVYLSYMDRFDQYGSLFGGIYEAFETYMGTDQMDLNAIYAYDYLRNLTHNVLKGRLFVLSPYVNANKDLVQTSLQMHIDGFAKLCKVCDIIAVQEGRGCGKNSYFENFQLSTPIEQIDPKLDEIVRYLNPARPKSSTFSDVFYFRSQDLFAGFYRVIQQLGD